MDEESGQVVEPERGSYTGSGSEGDDDDEEFDEGDYDGIDMTSIKVISTTNEVLFGTYPMRCIVLFFFDVPDSMFFCVLFPFWRPWNRNAPRLQFRVKTLWNQKKS
mmetsp:Transcript_35990/g.143899  ORF Transcript_35990/g.143899 Transcript_35990/m.143899 type:complete len:106 (+) Transcript_35990:2088-2405(+)